MGRQSSPQTQRGAVLIVALIFLVVLTVAGITAMRFSTMEERMASNVQFRNQTFQIAQSELRYQLLALNQNLANRAPLLVAMTNGPEDPDPDTNPIMKVLPDSTRLPHALTAKMQNHLMVSQVRSLTPQIAGKKTLCFDGSNIDQEIGFSCLDFELSTVAALDNSCPPDYKCGANSSQAMGITFQNN